VSGCFPLPLAALRINRSTLARSIPQQSRNPHQQIERIQQEFNQLQMKG